MKQKSKDQGLYFIAIVIKGEVGELIFNDKLLFAEKYNSKAALRSPSHITLHMPFRKQIKDEYKIAGGLNEVAQAHRPIPLRLKNYNCFAPRTIYIDIEPSAPLNALQRDIVDVAKRKLNLFNANHKQHPFTPHITIAFRDLSKPDFYLAWEEFKSMEFDKKYVCKHLTLLKHNGQIWEVAQEFELSG